jgi:hypothetical protein
MSRRMLYDTGLAVSGLAPELNLKWEGVFELQMGVVQMSELFANGGRLCPFCSQSDDGIGSWASACLVAKKSPTYSTRVCLHMSPDTVRPELRGASGTTNTMPR